MSYASYYSDKLLPRLSIKWTFWKICNKICSIVSKHEKSTAPAAPMSAKTVLLMRLQGLEPWTPWLRVRCSTNWASGAYIKLLQALNLQVHRQGFEPWTPWLRVRCSTNWAKSAYPSSEVITSATLLILPQKSLFVNNFFKVFLFFSNFFQSFLFPVGTAPFSDRSPSSIIAFIIC